MATTRRRDNQLLGLVPARTREQLNGTLELVRLEAREQLYDIGETIRFVYFPVTVVVSMITEMDDGSRAEVATVGNEGMIGLPVFLGARSIPLRCFAQIEGDALRMRAEDLRDRTANGGPLSDVLRKYTQALLNQIAYTAACNRLHNVEQRAARWILMTADRVEQNEFPLTQDFLAQMLGVRRASVSEVASRLQSDGLIRYDRGVMCVTDRRRLEGVSCECYARIRKEYDRLLRATA